MENFSSSHLRYLKNERNRTVMVHFVRIAVLLAILILWEVLSQLNIIDPFIMSSPSRIVVTIIDLFQNGNLLFHIGVTLFETLVGFAIATVLGTFIGFLNWYSDFLNKVTEPYLVILNSLPKIALGPIIVIWFGSGYNSIIVMTVLICIITTIITVQNAFLAVPQEKIQLMRGMGASKLDIFNKLIFKASLPTTITMLKINVGLSFVGSIMGEYLVSRFGLGYLIVYGGQVFKLDLVLACTIILMVLAGIIYFLVSLLERLVIRYK